MSSVAEYGIINSMSDGQRGVAPMRKRISIIITCFNYEKYVATAIDSVLSQTRLPDEIVVVDDGSTDRSRDIISSYAGRVNAIFQQNGGVKHAKNQGFAAVSGDIVLFLDADDVLLADALQEIEAVWSADTAKVQFELGLIDSAGQNLNRLFCNFPQSVPAEATARVFRETGTYNWPVSTGNAYAKAFLDQIMPITDDGVPDGILNTVAPLFGRVTTITDVMGQYRLHGSNLSRAGTTKDYPDFPRRIKTRVQEFEFLRRMADRRGVALPKGNLLDNEPVFINYRLMAQRLGQTYIGYEADSAFALWKRALLLTWRSDRRISGKLVNIAWFTSILLSTKAMAHGLIRFRFNRAEVLSRMKSPVASLKAATSSSQGVMAAPCRPRIAIISTGSDSYGTLRSIESLLGAFKQLGVDPLLVCLTTGGMTELAVKAGCDFVVADITVPEEFSTVRSAVSNVTSSLYAARKLSAILKTHAVERAIVRRPMLVPIAAKACWLARVPGFWLMPNLVSDRYPLRFNALVYDLLLARYGMRAIANSHFTQKSLLNFFSRSSVSHLGIDPVTFDPDNTEPVPRAQFGFSGEDAVFGICGRMVPYKGQLIFLRAMARVLPEFPQMRLIICGGPTKSTYADELRRAITELDLGGKALLVGTNEELGVPIARVYATCDVIVNSRLDPEPFGLSIIEGMLMRRPLLVHANGGPAETVRDEIDGWHINGPTVDAFEVGLRRVMQERGRWAELGENARQHALQEFTHLALARRLMKIMGIAV